MLNNFQKYLICWGGSDQCIEINSILISLGIKMDLIVDDTPEKVSPFSDVELVFGQEGFLKWIKGRELSQVGFLITIANPYGFIRCKLHNYLISYGLTSVSVCDSSALVAKTAMIGEGAQIMKGAIVNTDAMVGKQCILNTKSLVEHHCKLGAGVEVGPGATLCGRVTVEDYSWVCAGATILPRKLIGSNAIIGAGATLLSDVPDTSVFAGVPARYIKENKIVGSEYE